MIMNSQTKQKKNLPKEAVKQKLRERKKLSKELLKQKRARLVIKNLSFKVTEEKLQEFFGQYGDISNVELLKKIDGKLLGCAFIQYKLVQKAAKARHHTNGKHFLGRQIQVDFAKPKCKYNKETNINTITNNVNIPIEVSEDVIKIENESDSRSDDERGSQNSNNSNEIMTGKSEQYNEIITDEIRMNYFSHDVSEGKTVFVKNVPFNATNVDLKQCMSQFGRIYYALICLDKFTEHSKGTGFVKFVNKEDAERVLSAGTELKLFNNILDCHPAVDRKDMQDKIRNKVSLKNQTKDSRNLYLVKEGVIPPGSSAAQGVSATDMAKRAQIEQYKTQMLRKLNMFVSKERLVVHNLPASWDDSKLRTLFQKYAGPGAVIKEARIMRDRKTVDDSGRGPSKQYGFVTFTEHENALTALRNLNNNPNIFSVNKRPIVVFSIENRSAIVARQKRLEKSKEHNREKNSNSSDTKTERNKNLKSKKFKQFLEKKRILKMKEKKTSQAVESATASQFSGVQVNKRTN